MRIWVVASVAPRDVRDVVDRASERLGIEAVLVEGDRAQTHIAAHAEAGDVVITSDPRLVAHLVPRGVAALDVRGTEYTTASVESVETDHATLRLLQEVRELAGNGGTSGGAAHGPPPYDARAKREFASALDRLLTRLLPGHGHEP